MCGLPTIVPECQFWAITIESATRNGVISLGHYLGFFGVLALVAGSSLVFAIPVGGLIAALNTSGSSAWMIPAHGIAPERRLSSTRLMMASWGGSFVGVILSVISFIVAERWDELWYPDRVHDGQGILVTVISAPICGFLGSVLVAVGIRLFFCSSDRLWSAPFQYSGNRPTANKLVVSAIAASLLGCVFLCGFVVNWELLHPGPF